MTDTTYLTLKRRRNHTRLTHYRQMLAGHIVISRFTLNPQSSYTIYVYCQGVSVPSGVFDVLVTFVAASVITVRFFVPP